MEFLDLGKSGIARYLPFYETTGLTFLPEYPTLRTFTMLPGIVPSDLSDKDEFVPFAKDEGELSGVLGLYLASTRGDYLKGSLVSVNWDVEEMESHKDEIREGLLKNKWLPVLPSSGGSGW
jgi:hypothetical protein